MLGRVTFLYIHIHSNKYRTQSVTSWIEKCITHGNTRYNEVSCDWIRKAKKRNYRYSEIFHCQWNGIPWRIRWKLATVLETLTYCLFLLFNSIERKLVVQNVFYKKKKKNHTSELISFSSISRKTFYSVDHKGVYCGRAKSK